MSDKEKKEPVKLDGEIWDEQSVDVPSVEVITGEDENSAFLETGVFTYKFKKPFSWEGITYDKLMFDFGGLSGIDLKEIERELASEGRIAFSPLYSDAYLMGIAARAANVHPSVIEHMPIKAAMEIRERTRSFFMQGD